MEKESSHNDKYWWNYKISWEASEGEHQANGKDLEETRNALKSLKNRNEFEKDEIDDDKFYFPSYSGYIRPKEIISLQRPLSTNPDERVFIIVHQMFELVFKQMIFDFDVIAQTFSELLENKEFKERCEQKIPVHYAEFNNLNQEFDLLNQDTLINDTDSDEVKTQKKRAETRKKEIRRVLFWQAAFFASNRLIISVRNMLNVLTYYLDITAFSGLQFAQFRPFLLPASGFQTEQFRTIQMILGKSKCYSPEIFGAHEYFKKYKANYDEKAWERTATQDIETAKSFFVSVIDKRVYGKDETQQTDWQISGAKKALNIDENGQITSLLCEHVNNILLKIGETVTDDDLKNETYLKRFRKKVFDQQKEREEIIRNQKLNTFETAIDQFFDESDPLKLKEDEEDKYEDKIKEIKKELKAPILVNLGKNLDQHQKDYFSDEARKGMQIIASEHRDSFLMHILRNLSLVDGYLHNMDYSKRNRERDLRSSVLDRPYFSFLERHMDFIDNQISIVMEYEKGEAIAGTGGGGKNYFEFAMRLYELFPAFPAVDEHVVK